MGSGGSVEIVLDEPGLDDRGTGAWVELDEAVHVGREIENDRAALRLPCEARPAPPGEDRDGEAAGRIDGGHDIVRIHGVDDPDRFDRIHARVRGEEVPRVRVEAHLASDEASQLCLDLAAGRRLARRLPAPRGEPCYLDHLGRTPPPPVGTGPARRIEGAPRGALP